MARSRPAKTAAQLAKAARQEAKAAEAARQVAEAARQVAEERAAREAVARRTLLTDLKHRFEVAKAGRLFFKAQGACKPVDPATPGTLNARLVAAQTELAAVDITFQDTMRTETCDPAGSLDACRHLQIEVERLLADMARPM